MACYITVSTISYRPEKPPEDIAGRLEQARIFAARTARMGADIVTFPEIYIPNEWHIQYP